MRVLATGALLLAAMANSTAAEDLGKAAFRWTSEGPVMELEPGHLYSVGTFAGVLDFADDSAVLEDAVQDCMGYADLGELAGHCAIRASNGDQLFTKLLCGPAGSAAAQAFRASSCSHIIVGGTGMFDGATGRANSASVELTSRQIDDTLGHNTYLSSGYDSYSRFDLVLAD